MNDEDIMNIVDNIFKEIDVDDIIEEMGGKSDEDGPLSDDIVMALAIAVMTSQKLTKKL